MSSVLVRYDLRFYFTVITQWSVLAVHNLCENNEANQRCIQQMTLQGLAHKAEDLQAMGMDAQLQDGRIVVKSSKK